MSNGLSTQNSRLGRFGTFEPSSNSTSSTSYNMTNGFNNSKSNWSGSIWGSGGFGRGLGDTNNEGSRLKGSSGTAVETDFEGKTGSGSLLASSEYDGWDRVQSVPWHTSNATSSSNASSNKSISPVRRRIAEPSGSRPTNQSNGRSASPFFTLGASIDRQDDDTPFQSQLSPGAMDGFPQRIPETSPFAAFSTRSAAVGEHRQESSTAGFAVSSSQQMPSLSRSISQGESHGARNGLSLVNDDSLSRIKTTSSMNSRMPPSAVPSSQAHNSHRSVSTSTRRPPHSTQPSFHSLAYDSLNRAGGDDIEFTPGFSRMNLQNVDYQSYGSSTDPAARYDALNPHESASSRQRQPYGPTPTFSTSTAQPSQLVPQNRYQYGQQPSHRNGSGSVNGFMTPNPPEARKHLPNSSYSLSSTPPSLQDVGNATNDFASQGTNVSAAMLDRRLKGLQPLQQEPANYVPGQPPQNVQYQSRMQYPPAYDFGTYPVRLNSVGNPYAMPPYLGFVQPSMGPRFSARDNDPMRSPLLEEFRTNNKTNKRFELKDIYHHVVEFAGDQHGSRFIQQKLETANSDEKDQIFNEIQPNSLQLMTDLFGNYVIQKLFEHGNQSQKKILANQMKGHVLSLSNQMYGCRVVQKALEHILTDQQASLINELNGKGLVLQCVRDQNGNHVVQKAIERVPPEHIQFIIDAFLGQVGQLATHAYGCRVIQRMLEHCEEPARRDILQEIHACISTLIIDQFGNYVIQHVIEHGNESDRSSIVSIVVNNVLSYSKHKFASNVVEKSIEFGAPDQRAEILRLLTCPNDKGENPVLGLVRDQYGNYVIQKVLTVLKASERDNLINQIKPHITSLKKISCGKQIIAIEKIILDVDFDSHQSSQSSSLPSTNASTVDGPVTPGPSIGIASPSASMSGSVDGNLVKTPTGPAMFAENGF